MDGISYEKVSMNGGQMFMAYISEDKIISGYGGQVGRTEEAYKQLWDVANGFKAKAEEYRQKLEDAGLLEKVRTPEEIGEELREALKRQQETMAQMTAAIAKINDKLFGGKEDDTISHPETGGKIPSDGKN